jgi:anti-sigma-K factor RskA
LAVAVAALVVTNVGDSDESRTARVTLTGSDSAQAVLHVLEDGLLVMEADGLEPLESEQTYQVWAIRAGRPESIGLLGLASEGEVQAALRADLSGVEAVAVTVEPAGGSLEPTGRRVLESEEISLP